VYECYLTDTSRHIHDRIANEQFDVMLICRGWLPLVLWEDIQAHYVCQGGLQAPITFGYWIDPFPLEMWVPVSRRGASGGATPNALPK